MNDPAGPEIDNDKGPRGEPGAFNVDVMVNYLSSRARASSVM